MIDAHEQHGRSVIALQGGPARGDLAPTAASTPEAGRRPAACRSTASSRSRSPRTRRRTWRHGPLRVHARDLRRARPHQARRRRRDPAHRRHRPPARPSRRCTATRSTRAATTSARSSTTCGPPSSWPLDRDDLGPEFRPSSSTGLRCASERRRLIAVRDPARRRRRRHVARRACAPLRPGRRGRWPTRSGCVLAEAVTSPRGGAAVRQHAMDGYAVRAADTAGARRGARSRCRWSATLAGRAAAPTVAVGAGRGDADHDRRADARRRRRGRDGRAHRRGRRRTTVVRRSRRSAAGDHVRRAGDDVAGRRRGRPGRHGARARPTSACWPASAATEVAVVPRPRVGVLSTGDELVDGRRRWRPARSATPTGRCSLALVAGSRLRGRRPRPGPRRRGRASTRALARGRGHAATPCVTSGGVSWATSTS